MKEIIKIELAEINEENGTDYQMSDIEIDLTPDIPTNEAENLASEKTKAETQQIRINTVLDAAVNIGYEAALQAICDILELDYEEIKDQVEKMPDGQSPEGARALLEGVVTDEQTAENSSGAIPE